MITREQVADLRPGDVVEITDERWPEGTVLRGAAYFDDGDLRVGHLALATRDGRLYLDRPRTTLTVVSRAPRPLYVNSDRAEPVPGDVVRDADDDDAAAVYVFDIHSTKYGWWMPKKDRRCGYGAYERLPARLLLLVDGTTGQAVTP